MQAYSKNTVSPAALERERVGGILEPYRMYKKRLVSLETALPRSCKQPMQISVAIGTEMG